MLSFLQPGAGRRLDAANFVSYPEPSLHPDRVMSEHDLVFLIEGEWEICQSGQRYLMDPGDVLLLEAGQHHYGEMPCAPGTRTMYLHIAAHPQDGRQLPGCLKIPTLTKASALNLRRGFQQIINEFYSSNPYRTARIAALIDLLLCDLAVSENSAHEQWPVGAVRSILLNQPNVNYTADELAEKLHLPVRRLRYLFQNACGQPLHQYQLTLKLDMARQLLIAEPDRTLSDVAETFGFTDAFHLSHAYKRRFGHAPRDKQP